MATADAKDRFEDVRRLVATHARGRPAATVVPLGSGCDHTAYLVDDGLVVRFADDPEGGTVEREARLLAAVAELSPLPIPVPVFVVAAERCLAYERLPGAPLLDLPADQRMRHAAAVGERLGPLLSALHDADPHRMAGLVGKDDTRLEEWLGEAAELYAATGPAIQARHRTAIEAFLGAPVPRRAGALVFSHNDLGIEHVLVGASPSDVTGVIDWADAAIVDPARDFGLLLRDLGVAGLDAALAAYEPAADLDELRARALFYARCSLLEDLHHGLRSGRRQYADKSLAGLAWLFPA